MAKDNLNPTVNFYFSKADKWREEISYLRTLVLNSELTEELKWGVPCYTVQKSNVVLIHVFKDYCALLFHKGVLLKDPNHILVQQTENVQSARQLRFTSLKEIMKLKAVIDKYVKEAIQIEKAGLKVELKKTSEFKMPEEFQVKLKTNLALKKAFEKLSPGRQRAYLLFFSAPKQSKTREARIEKYTSHILIGKGLTDV